MKCPECGCPYVTNVLDGDIRFDEIYTPRDQSKEITALHKIIQELAAIVELGFYGTTENAARKAKIVNDPVVLRITETK